MDRLRWTLVLGALAAVGVALASSTVRPAPAPAAIPDAPPIRSVAPPPPAAAAAPAAPAMFAPTPPPVLRRLPTRPMTCTLPPPPGRFTLTITTATREEACGAAIEALTEAMDTTEDHCGLYRAVWTCFVARADRLFAARAETLDDFVLLLPRFESHDGFETALATWDADPRARTVLTDLFGAPTVADTLTRFLELEVAAIEGLAAEYAAGDASPVLIDAWARREAVMAWHREGPVWELVRAHRAGVTERFDEALARVAAGPTPPAVGAARARHRTP